MYCIALCAHVLRSVLADLKFVFANDNNQATGMLPHAVVAAVRAASRLSSLARRAVWRATPRATLRAGVLHTTRCAGAHKTAGGGSSETARSAVRSAAGAMPAPGARRE